MRKRDLLRRANYTKIVLLTKALITFGGVAFLSLLFVWRGYGLVDIVASYTVTYTNLTDTCLY